MELVGGRGANLREEGLLGELRVRRLRTSAIAEGSRRGDRDGGATVRSYHLVRGRVRVRVRVRVSLDLANPNPNPPPKKGARPRL